MPYIGSTFLAFRGRFQEYDLARLDGIERAGRISRAFSGKRAQTTAYSEMCRYCSVPDRIERTRMMLLLLNSSFSAAPFTKGCDARKQDAAHDRQGVLDPDPP